MQSNENMQEEVVDTQEVSQDQSAASQSKTKAPQESWEELRKKAARATQVEEELGKYKKVLEQIKQEALEYQNKQKSDEQEKNKFDWNSIDEDDYVSGDKLKSALSDHERRLEEKARLLEEKQKRYEEEQKKDKEDRALEKLQANHTDWDKVMTYENAVRLKELDPDLAESIYFNPDPTKKSRALYNAIKRYQIYKEEEPLPSEDDVLREDNMHKPRTASSIRSSSNALANASLFSGKMTREKKGKIYQRALELARGVD